MVGFRDLFGHLENVKETSFLSFKRRWNLSDFCILGSMQMLTFFVPAISAPYFLNEKAFAEKPFQSLNVCSQIEKISKYPNITGTDTLPRKVSTSNHQMTLSLLPFIEKLCPVCSNPTHASNCRFLRTLIRSTQHRHLVLGTLTTCH